MALIDLTSGKVLLRVRRRVDASGRSERATALYRVAIQGCDLALDVRAATEDGGALRRDVGQREGADVLVFKELLRGTALCGGEHGPSQLFRRRDVGRHGPLEQRQERP